MLTPVENQVYDAIQREEELEQNSLGGYYVPRSVINSWKLIPTNTITDAKLKKKVFRVNSFANLFYFAVQVLQKNKLQLNPDPRKNLHFQMCMAVMKDGLKEVIEIPRDHFKSTIYSEAFPMWRALPFSEEDEEFIRKIYAACGQNADLYIMWMKRAHQRDIRILLCSEITKNAQKLGKRVRNHYENNGFFRNLFEEVLPDASCVWTNESLHQLRTLAGRANGEGTYDFIGVGGALQSTHYDFCIEDDLVGKDALKSETVMNDTIEYHKLLVGAMDADSKDAGRDFDELVVGNRWSYKDLNSHIRAEEPDFNFITHSALGGCCALHKYGEPIFPEAFNLLKLARYQRRLGTYLFSCQFLNYPVNPEKCKFNAGDLKYFEYVDDESNTIFQREEKRPTRKKIRHRVNQGDVDEDIFPRNLQRYMVIDPNHSGNKGRCRHAITITGVRQDRRRVYLLKQWAKACAIEEFVSTIFKLALAFKITTIHIETVGAQKYLKFHLEYFITVNKGKKEWEGIEYIRFADLKSSNTENAKIERIDSFIPIVERREFYVNTNDCAELLEEIEKYGNKGGLVDILDTLGYGTQIWKFQEVDDVEIEAYMNMQKQRFMRAQARA
jgi:hypothetical protein